MCVCREVWPDRREFGVEGMSMQDEFMSLREICFTQLPSLSLGCVLFSYVCLHVFLLFLESILSFTIMLLACHPLLTLLVINNLSIFHDLCCPEL